LLPDTHCTVNIYEDTDNIKGFIATVAHHDSPMGETWYCSPVTSQYDIGDKVEVSLYPGSGIGVIIDKEWQEGDLFAYKVDYSAHGDESTEQDWFDDSDTALYT